ncbi:MAG: ATP-binding protein [Gemmatimonadaceae bacterium]
MRKSVVLSWSGGKDSALALDALARDPEVEVVGLVTSITTDYDRISVHGVRRSMLEAQVARIGLPLFEIPLPALCSNEAYEAAFHRALERIRHERPSVTHIAFGDLFLTDVRAYRERLLAGTGIEPLFPLWGLDTTLLAKQFVEAGFSARLVCVDTTQLNADFAGREFDHELLADLPATVDPCGERGEFHTFVSNGPQFTNPVVYALGDSVLRDERFMYCDLKG